VIMRRNRLIAAAATAAAVIGIAATASIAATAFAAQAVPSGTGAFRTWHGAQSAAGFSLMKPTRTYGLARAGRIFVSRCDISRKKGTKRLVIAGYGSTPFANLTLTQNNSGGPCAIINAGKNLGRYRVNGTWANLIGDCGRAGLPRCSSRNIHLFLSWRKNSAYYQASSYGRRPAVLVGFARGLVPVG
jgi:hypothetical protein